MRDLGPKGSAMWGSGWFLRPAADRRLLPRTNNVRLTLGKTVIGSFATENDQVRLQLDDGTTRTVDSVVAGTGYRVNLDRLGFLSPDLLNTIKTRDGSPVLNRAMESSAARLYFTGAAAAAKFGPLTWFGGQDLSFDTGKRERAEISSLNASWRVFRLLGCVFESAIRAELGAGRTGQSQSRSTARTGRDGLYCCDSWLEQVVILYD